MIGVKLEGKDGYLELPPDASISLRLENPIFFDPDKISPGSYSLPFDLPGGKKSPENAAALKNPDVIENVEDFATGNASLFYSGLPLKHGKLNVLETLGDKLQTYFTFGLNSISDSFKTAKLRDVLSETVVINSDAVVRKVHTNSLQINIIVNGIDYTQSNWYYEYGALYPGGPSNKRFPNGATEEYSPFIQEVTTNSPGNRIVGYHWLVRMVKFQYVWSILGDVLTPIDCTDPNIQFEVEVVQDAVSLPFIMQPEMDGYYDGFTDWLEPFLNNTIPITSPLKHLRFPTIASDKLNDSKNDVLINHSDGDGHIIFNTPEKRYTNGIAVPSNINSIQPFITLRGVLEKIATYFEFEFEGDFWADARVDYTLLWNTTALDTVQKYIQGQDFNLWRRSFNINELVPDITVVEFLRMLQAEDSFNLAVYYSELTKKVRLSYRENIAKAIAYDDITSKASLVKSNSPVELKASVPIASLSATYKNINLSALNLAIDEINTVVVNESSPGANNGSITVATNKDVTLYEFSKNGTTWQSSNVFSGLTRAIYVIHAREILSPSFENEYPFAVNRANPTFDYNVVVTGESFPGANDGHITVNPDVVYTSFEFTKNAGASWQSVNVFSSLSPGTYYVAARDAADNAIVRVVSVDKNYSATDIQTGVPQFAFKQGDSFNLQFMKYEGLNTIDTYSYPYISLYTFPTSPIWKKMMGRILSVKIDMSMNLVDIINLDWELKRRYNRSNFIFKAMDVKLIHSGLKVVEVELYTMR